jgi:hypothetical protein
MPQYPHWEQHNDESGHKPFPRFALPHVPMTEAEGLKGDATGSGLTTGWIGATGLIGWTGATGITGCLGAAGLIGWT